MQHDSKVVRQYQRAREFLAGGVSSSTRLNQALGHAMLFAKADGCRVWDLDGRDYIDLCCSHGATLLGHGDARVRAAIESVLDFGAPCSYESEIHAELAQELCASVPCLELVRFTGSGTEATMHCLRLARAFTGRQKFIRFEGNFHGYHDQVMFTGETLGGLCPALKPISAGVAAGMADHIVQVPYNNPELLELAFQRWGDQLAAAICEPVYYNAGCILPTPEFMATLRRCTERAGTVLIFDEVLSAFRMGPGGAQEYLKVTPDLCTLGKAVGGSYPLSVFGGRREIMNRLMPTGDCQHSGTYNGHPVMVAAALAAVRTYRAAGFYEHIREISSILFPGIRELFTKHGVVARVQGLGARFGIYFGATDEVRNYQDAQRHDRAKMLRFIAAAIQHGVYFHDYGGAACHHGFCAAMTRNDVTAVLQRLDQALAQLNMHPG
jgi:glutamate-1-semialdehyde 2,1-aminomutase